MDTAATRDHEYSVFDPVLYLAFELSNVHWKLGFATGPGRRPRVRTINAGDLAALREEVRRAKKRFELSGDIRVVSCTVLRQHGLRGRERWLLVAPLSVGARDREPCGGQLEHSGESTSAAGEDRRDGRGEAVVAADPLPKWGTGRVERGAGAERRSGGQSEPA